MSEGNGGDKNVERLFARFEAATAQQERTALAFQDMIGAASKPWWMQFVVPIATVICAAFAAYLTVKVDTALLRADLSSLTGQVSRIVTTLDDVARWKETHLTGHAQPNEPQRGGRR